MECIEALLPYILTKSLYICRNVKCFSENCMISVVVVSVVVRKMSQERDADDIGFLYKTMGL